VERAQGYTLADLRPRRRCLGVPCDTEVEGAIGCTASSLARAAQVKMTLKGESRPVATKAMARGMLGMLRLVDAL
jgi:hypothetical protein